MKVPLEPWPNVVDGVGDRGLEGGSLCWCGQATPARGLPRLLRLPQQGSFRETCFVHLLSVVLVFGIALIILWLRLLPFALLSVDSARESDCPRTSKGYKGVPLL